MGRLSQYFRYLQTPPENMQAFKFREDFIPTEKDKKLRRDLKLYEKIKSEDEETTTDSTEQV